MNILVLGKGKTGSIVAEIARERGHQVTALASKENERGSALSPQNLQSHGIHVVVDFTAPDAVIHNIRACAGARVNMVVGTTGWYDHVDSIRAMVHQAEIGFVYGSNFSVGVNVFFEVIRAAAAAVPFGYDVRLIERHHAGKKDTPSGTAVTLHKIIQETSNADADITSLREGDVVGTHTALFDSEFDTMMLVHDAKSRRGFAAGAVQAAEWVQHKKGFYEFKDVFREMRP